MSAKIFCDKNGTWFGFIAPEKPLTSTYEMAHQQLDAEQEYADAYATARAAALPILNPEIIKQTGGKNDQPLGILINGIFSIVDEDEDYDWPGDMKVEKGCVCTDFIEGYILSIPNSKDESKMKTAEDYWALWSTEFPGNDRKMTEAMFKACIRECQQDCAMAIQKQQNFIAKKLDECHQQWEKLQASDQQLAAFKEKLKQMIDKTNVDEFDKEVVKALVDHLNDL